MTKRIIFGAVAILLVIASAYAAFFIAPEERTMGLIQRIFYFHVYPAPGPVRGVFPLLPWQFALRLEARSEIRLAGGLRAEVGLAFTTVVLITGPVWAHPVWASGDMGRAPYFHVCLVATLLSYLVAAHFGS